jgi:hypothetical protein
MLLFIKKNNHRSSSQTHNSSATVAAVARKRSLVIQVTHKLDLNNDSRQFTIDDQLDFSSKHRRRRSDYLFDIEYVYHLSNHKYLSL